MFLGCLMRWVGKLTEEKCCVFNEISRMVNPVTIACCKQNLATFEDNDLFHLFLYYSHTRDVSDTVFSRSQSDSENF
jgi:hypothetical protein